MSLEQLTRRALDSRQLDPRAADLIRQRMSQKRYLTPDEYEALRRLGRALKSGEVVYSS